MTTSSYYLVANCRISNIFDSGVGIYEIRNLKQDEKKLLELVIKCFNEYVEDDKPLIYEDIKHINIVSYNKSEGFIEIIKFEVYDIKNEFFTVCIKQTDNKEYFEVYFKCDDEGYVWIEK